MKTVNICKYLAVLALIVSGLSGCIKDTVTDGPGIGAVAGDKMVTISMSVPGAVKPRPSTRSMTDEQERDIETAHVMLFYPAGHAKAGQYYTTVQGRTITGTGSNRSFEVKVPVGTYDFVVLANAQAAISAAAIASGSTKAEVMGRLQFENTAKWSTGATAPVIPMWGEKTDFTITESTTAISTSAAPLFMHRMVAKVSVQLSNLAASGDADNATDTDNFRLGSVYLYNYNTRGNVAPDTTGENWQTGDGTEANPALALKPTLPANVGKPANGTKFSYSADDDATAAGTPKYGDYFGAKEMKNTIYTFEAANTPDMSAAERPCVVIGGYYGGSTTQTYYRVDFVDESSGTPEYLNLVRNHNYIFLINSVTGEGLSSADDAYNSHSTNIEAEVLDWRDPEMPVVAYDGINYLALSRSEFTFDRAGVSTTVGYLKIITNNSGGWSATVSGSSIDKSVPVANDAVTGNAWVTINKPSGTTGETTDITVATNGTTGERKAWIHVTSGRLNIIVPVTQTTTADMVGIRIFELNADETVKGEISSLEFADMVGVQPAARKMKVTWSPENADLIVTNTRIGTNAFPSGAGVGAPASGTVSGGNGGTGIIYTIQPPAITSNEIASNPFLEKVSRVDFTTTDGVDYANKSVFLRQVNCAVVPVRVPDYCLLDGKQHSFGIRSNTAWKIESVTQRLSDETPTTAFLPTTPGNGDNMIKDHTGGYNVRENGEEITFTVVDDDTKTLSGTIEVVFTSPDGLFKPVTVTIEIVNSIWSRSNIVWIEDSSLSSGGILTFAVTRDDHTSPDRTIKVVDDEGSHDVSVQPIPANSQGVFFKWGSLVAISPSSLASQSSGAQAYVANPYPDGHVLFSPVTLTKYAYTDIPYFKPADFKDGIWGDTPSNDDDFKNYDGISNTSGPGYDASGRGDICRYISAKGWVDGNWRLPTGAEINDLIGQEKRDAGDWANSITNVAPANSGYGFYAPAWGGLWLGKNAALSTNTNKVNPEYGIFVPASGYRNSIGSAYYAGFYGHFWSGSSRSSTNGFYLYIYPDSAIQDYADRGNGFPVRCVRDN